MRLLILSFYDLNYSIGASASLIDFLLDLPKSVEVIVIEPLRVDLPEIHTHLPANVKRVKVIVPLNGLLAVLIYPLLAFLTALEVTHTWKPHVIMSMYHPFHALSIVGHLLSKILHVPHVVDVRDVWRPMGLKVTLLDRIHDIFERTYAKILHNDLLVFVCHINKLYLESRSNTEFNYVVIWPNCVSYRLIKTIRLKTRQYRKTIRFVFVGRIGSEYGLEYITPLIDTLKNLGYKIYVYIAGHKHYEKVPPDAIFLGILSRRDALRLIAECDIGIGPLYPTMAIPRKVIEYLSLNKPVIVGNGALDSTFLIHFKNRIVIVSREREDYNQLSKSILSFLEDDQKNKMGTSTLYCKNRIRAIFKALHLYLRKNKQVYISYAKKEGVADYL